MGEKIRIGKSHSEQWIGGTDLEKVKFNIFEDILSNNKNYITANIEF